MRACHLAGVIAGQTVTADLRPYAVDRAGYQLAHGPPQGTAASAVTPYSGARRGNERPLNLRDIRIAFQGEAWPFARKRAARTTRAAIESRAPRRVLSDGAASPTLQDRMSAPW